MVIRNNRNDSSRGRLRIHPCFWILVLILKLEMSFSLVAVSTTNARRFLTKASSACRYECRHSKAFRLVPACKSTRLYSSSASSSSSFKGTTTTSTYDDDDARLVQDMLYRVRQVNDRMPAGEESLIPFVVDDMKLGKVTPSMAEMLVSATPNSPFQLLESTNTLLTLSSDSTTCESRTDAVMGVMQELRSRSVITGWRDELYPIGTDFYQPPVFLMERAAVPFVGGLEYGVHMNGLVWNTNKDEFCMWMARRSKDKSKFPGMLDHIVAGGQPSDLGLFDNVVKECSEEAGIPPALTRSSARAAGAISYETYSKHVVSRAVLFCFDLNLPSDFVPTPVDGEVQEFFLWTLDELKASMAPDFHDPIKPNCYPVIIDCLLRHGHVSPEAPGYLDLLRELRSGECR